MYRNRMTIPISSRTKSTTVGYPTKSFARSGLSCSAISGSDTLNSIRAPELRSTSHAFLKSKEAQSMIPLRPPPLKAILCSYLFPLIVKKSLINLNLNLMVCAVRLTRSGDSLSFPLLTSQPPKTLCLIHLVIINLIFSSSHLFFHEFKLIITT